MKKLFIFLTIFIFCSNAHADIFSGLQVWWKFDEGSGTTAIDSSGKGNTGTLANSPSYVTGKIGPYALNFNGSSQYVDSSNIASIDNKPNFTVSVWFNSSAAQPDGCGGLIAGKVGPGGAIAGPGWGLGMSNTSCGSSNGQVGGEIGTDESDYLVEETTPTYNDGNWHQLVMVVTGGTTITLYVDGAIPAEYVKSSGTVTTYATTDNFRAADDYSGEYFNGKIDDVRVYNRALSASDVAQLYTYTSANYIRIKNARINQAKLGF